MVDNHQPVKNVDERRRRLLATVGGVTLGALGTGATGTAAAVEEDTLTILHDTHFHGRFQDSDYPELDIARYQTLVGDLLAEYPNAGFFGNGDDLAPSVLGLEFEGEHMIEALNEMEPAAIGAGNHEFDFGTDVATERFEESEFPWVIANLLTPEGEPVPGAERWTTVELGDHTVGVFGLGVENFHGITDYPDDWQVLGHEEASEEAVAALREAGAEFIVCASHANTGDHPTIASVDGVDAVVGSHSGVVFDEPDESHGAVISEFGDEFDHVGRLTFDVDSGELVDWERLDLYDSEELDEADYPEETDHHTPVDVQDVERDPGVAEIADEYIDELEERLGEPIVESEVELNASFDNYSIETGWGNLMTDLMREVGDLDEEIDVALQNAGGIRSDATYGPGEITGSDVMNILPFPNEIEVYELTGEQLHSYLEGSVRPMPDDFGAQPGIQVSGVSYEWTGHHDDGRARNVWVRGEPLEDDETYLVATNDFVAGRNDEFTEDGLVLHSGQFLGPFVMDLLDEEYETVAPEREHRMIRVDEVVDDVDADGDAETLTLSFAETDAMNAVEEGTFRLVAPEHGVVEAESVSADDGVEVALETEAVLDLFDDANVAELSLVGGFDPDEEYYDYDDSIELPANEMYDHYKVRVPVTAADVRPLTGDVKGRGADDRPDEGRGDEASSREKDC
ncbi:bifunctional metallophosphatase/5'-nucleotidase [Natronococcus pandeyae]|uniref:Bifunctional metallophosphatase/5'-nucleotidase n=1 Tax=Natronococcus pandeyae TaxID=2055836 RepID=A0A8J8Q182_9EURY|nr:5'-nucleotidase C-terminal domain-containing protein [Natronococcus pandeyae]TYL37107.1 bifunctional metallophosphatase/5'-nucleotidase [Natronococcus pandeyae]